MDWADRYRKQGTIGINIFTSIRKQAQRVGDAGGRVILTWLSNDEDVKGNEIANAAAQRAAKQQAKEMRLASLSYAKQAVETRWKSRAKIDEKIAKAEKSVAARYLQLRSGHAVIGAHLVKIGKVENATKLLLTSCCIVGSGGGRFGCCI